MTSPDVIRTWARSQGIQIGDRGRVARSIRESYEAANPAQVSTPTPDRSSVPVFTQPREEVPAAYVPHCQRCRATWTGLGRAHCGVCHYTFNSVGGFDKHRVDDGCRMKGLVQKDDGFWHLPGENDWSHLKGARHGGG